MGDICYSSVERCAPIGDVWKISCQSCSSRHVFSFVGGDSKAGVNSPGESHVLSPSPVPSSVVCQSAKVTYPACDLYPSLVM